MMTKKHKKESKLMTANLKLSTLTFTTTEDVQQRIDALIRANPGLSFTWLMNQAILNFLDCPSVSLRRGDLTSENDTKKFLLENLKLMEDLD